MEGIRGTGAGHAARGAGLVRRVVLLGLVVTLPALVLAQELGTTSPKARERYDQGMDRLKTGKWAEAAAEFTAARDLDPAFAEAHMRLGQARASMRFFTEAQICLEKAVNLKPDLLEARISLVSVLMERNADDRAESEAKRLLTLEQARDRPEPHILLGQIAFRRAQRVANEDPNARLARYEESVAHFQRAVDLAADNPVFRYDLGMALLRTGRLVDAERHLRHAVQVNPKSSVYQFQLGEVCFLLGRYLEAREHLVAASRDEKRRDADLYTLLMRAGYRLGMYQDAARWAALAHRAAPDNPQVLLLSATIHRHLGNHTLAEDFVRQALRLEAKQPGADYELGMLYFDRGQWRAAVDFLRKATQIQPNEYRGWYQLGLALRCLEQTDESDRALARFQELKDEEQTKKERTGIEAGPPDRLFLPTTRPAAGS